MRKRKINKKKEKEKTRITRRVKKTYISARVMKKAMSGVAMDDEALLLKLFSERGETCACVLSASLAHSSL